MVSMNISNSDKALINTLMHSAMLRRKQLCPWTLTAREVESLYLTPEILRLGDELEQRMDGLLHKTNVAVMQINAGTKTILVHARYGFASRLRTPSPGEGLLPVLPYDSDARAKFVVWVAQAVRVQTETQAVQVRVHALLEDCTTQNQLMKACPELLHYAQACTTAPVVGRHGRRPWQSSRDTSAAAKLSSLSESIPDGTTSRARLKSPQVAEDGKILGALLRRYIPEALLLPEHNGLAKGAEFDNAWIQIETR